MNIKDFRKGDIFEINDKLYRSRRGNWTMTVTFVGEKHISMENDFDGISHTLAQTALDFYGDKVRIIQKAEPVICSNCGRVCLHGQDHWDCQLGIVPGTRTLALPAASPLAIAKAKVAEILSSNHVASVEVGLDEEYGNVRIYRAVTKDGGIPHLYTIRVSDDFENGEKITTAKCNCPANVKNLVCRHIEAVAKEDAARMNREIYPLHLANYRAHLKAA